MRPFMHGPIVVALPLALMLGCSERPGPTEPATVRPSLRAGQSPDGAGAVVIHDKQAAFLFVDVQPAPGLTVLVGWTLSELGLFCSTGELTVGALDERLVLRPDGTVHSRVHAGQAPLLVWQTAIPNVDPVGELCGELLGLPPLVGTGQLSITDNDVFVSGNRTDVAHVGIHGQVVSNAGERFQLAGDFHAMTFPTGDNRSRSDFRLVPLP